MCQALGPGQKPLTINPTHTEGFKDGHEEKAHAAGCVVIKELKHVHAALRGRGSLGGSREGPTPMTPISRASQRDRVGEAHRQ